LEGLRIENVGIFYGHWQYFTAIWYILWPLGNVVVILYSYPSFWYIVFRKIWQPYRGTGTKQNENYSEQKTHFLPQELFLFFFA
jgi:hypothetical protein